jgi:hypothetical protein
MSFRKVRTLDEIKRLVAENTAAKEALRSGISATTIGQVSRAEEIKKQLEPITKLLQAEVTVPATEKVPETTITRSAGWFFKSLNDQLAEQGVKSDTANELLGKIATKTKDIGDLVETTNEVLRENGATEQDIIRFQTLLYQEDPRIAELIVKYNQDDINNLEADIDEKELEINELLKEQAFLQEEPERLAEVISQVEAIEGEKEYLEKILDRRTNQLKLIDSYRDKINNIDNLIDNIEEDINEINDEILDDEKLLISITGKGKRVKKKKSAIKKAIRELNDEKDKLIKEINKLEISKDQYLNEISSTSQIQNEKSILENELLNLESQYNLIFDDYMKATNPDTKDELEERGNKLKDEISNIRNEIDNIQAEVERLQSPKTPAQKKAQKKIVSGILGENLATLKKQEPIPSLSINVQEDAVDEVRKEISSLATISSNQYRKLIDKLVTIFGYTAPADRKTVIEQLRLNKPLIEPVEGISKFQIPKASDYNEALSSALNSLIDYTPGVGGSGLKIGGQIDQRRLQLNKYSPYKIVDNILGALNIDANKLINNRLLTAQHVGSGEYLFKNKKVGDDLIHLLTKRFSKNMPYSPQAIADFGKLVKGSGLPMKRNNKKIQMVFGRPCDRGILKSPPDDSSDDDSPVIIFSSPEEMAERFEVLRASIGAGNTSKRARNEMSGILDKLFNLGFINKKEMKRLSQQSGIYR